MTRLLLDSEALTRLDAVLASPRGRVVGVLGLGVVGRQMALYLAERGAHVLGADRRADYRDEELAGAGVELRLGTMGEDTFSGVDALVISPGADPRQAAVRAVMKRGRPVLGELELLGKLPVPVAAITGTNGKSTTTALLGALVAAAGRSVFVGGNLGNPIVAWLRRRRDEQIAVVELSSFQLETAYRFCADVGVVLNVTPDHFERYDDVGAYADVKQRLVEQCRVAVLNADDPLVASMSRFAAGEVLWLSTRGSALPGEGAWLQGDRIVASGRLSLLDGVDLAHPRLFGRHNRENALAAWIAASALGVVDEESIDQLKEGYQSFCGLAHRLELIADVEDVRFINDSKATNDDAAAIAVRAMDRPVILLCGGRDKGTGYAQLVGAAKENVRTVIAYGEASPLIQAALAEHPHLICASDMRAAFEKAVGLARAGDVVLLAPACSSFDEFRDYKHRGETFAGLVHELGGGK